MGIRTRRMNRQAILLVCALALAAAGSLVCGCRPVRSCPSPSVPTGARAAGPAVHSGNDQAEALVRGQSTATHPGRSVTVTIRYAFWALNTRETKLLESLARRFQRENPAIRIQLMPIPQRYYDKLQILMVAEDAPDTFSANYGRLADFVRAGAVQDLRCVEPKIDDLAGHFLPAAWNATVTLGRAIGREGVWGLPKDWPPAGLLIFNRDLLHAAGVPEPPEDGWTWHQFRQACRQIAAADLPGIKPAAINLYPYSVFTWLYQAGARPVAEGRFQFSSPQSIKAMRFVLALYRDGLASRPMPGRDRSAEQFASGKVAFIFGTFYTVQGCRDIRDFQWGASVPLCGRERVCSCLPTFVAVSARTPHKKAAYRWAEFLALRGAEDYARAAVTAPAAIQSLAPGLFLAQPPLSAARGAVLAAMSVARTPPLHPTVPYERICDELRQCLEKTIATGADAADALKELDARLSRYASSASS